MNEKQRDKQKILSSQTGRVFIVCPSFLKFLLRNQNLTWFLLVS